MVGEEAHNARFRAPKGEELKTRMARSPKVLQLYHLSPQKEIRSSHPTHSLSPRDPERGLARRVERIKFVFSQTQRSDLIIIALEKAFNPR